ESLATCTGHRVQRRQESHVRALGRRRQLGQLLRQRWTVADLGDERGVQVHGHLSSWGSSGDGVRAVGSARDRRGITRGGRSDAAGDVALYANTASSRVSYSTSS